MKTCTICGKPIVLIPTAAERAKKYGGKPEDYEPLFTTHAACSIKKRSEETNKLMRAKHELKATPRMAP